MIFLECASGAVVELTGATLRVVVPATGSRQQHSTVYADPNTDPNSDGWTVLDGTEAECREALAAICHCLCSISAGCGYGYIKYGAYQRPTAKED